jgi:hypothetical protein
MKNFIDYYFEANKTTKASPITQKDKISRIKISPITNFKKFDNTPQSIGASQKWWKNNKNSKDETWINIYHDGSMKPDMWKSYSEFNKSGLEANTAGGEGLGLNAAALQNAISKRSDGLWKLEVPQQSEPDEKTIIYVFKGTLENLFFKISDIDISKEIIKNKASQELVFGTQAYNKAIAEIKKTKRENWGKKPSMTGLYHFSGSYTAYCWNFSISPSVLNRIFKIKGNK